MNLAPIEPYDVASLEKSLNDSATRVSAIWVSFLIFALYLLTAAVTVTHRQLLLAEPVKLPVLNIDLPIWGFFFLAPILFTMFHIYVLLQVLLLGRTAAAYNEALERTTRFPSDRAIIRQRLANTLFAQIFAGSPREREGWVGLTLRALAWSTLAIAPLFILLSFQFAFLAYQSHIATWTLRLLLLCELANVFLLWPLALHSERDFEWHRKVFITRLRRATHPLHYLLARPPLPKTSNQTQTRKSHARRGGTSTARFILNSLVGISFLGTSLFVASFPGEPHINLLTWDQAFSTQCERSLFRRFEQADLRIDRLVLPSVDVVDDERLAKLERATLAKDQTPHDGERTQSFRNRSLRCGNFRSADFRRTDFSAANLSGADLYGAELHGATLDNAKLLGADLSYAKLDDSSAQNTDFSEAIVKRQLH